MAATTWNSSDESGITLSNGNLTASVSTSFDNGVRSTTSLSSGKVYLEFTSTQVSSGGYTRIGCANSSWDESGIDLGRDANSFAYQSDGYVFIADSDSDTGTNDTYAASDVVQLCVDFDNQLLWVAKNNDGNWNGTSADPAAGTGGYSFSSITGPFFVGFCSGNTGDNITANFGDSTFTYTPPTGFAGWDSGRPPALADYPTWIQYANWNFGSNAGNNIQSITDLINAGWYPSDSFLNNRDTEAETFYTNVAGLENCQNFEVHSDHCDLVAIWNGGPITVGAYNGSITSIQTQLPLDLYTNNVLTSIAYIEGTFQCSNVSCIWPAWWATGHHIGGTYDNTSQGPEMDIMEIIGQEEMSNFFCTLHAEDEADNKCLLDADNSPNAPPATVDYDNTATSNVSYYNAGIGTYNLGAFEVEGVVDASNGFHKYGCLVEPDYTISFWIDGQKIGHFDATQHCDDNGTPVALNLLVDLAILGTDNNVAINTANFGGAVADNTTNAAPSGDQFRLSIQNIQIWGPPSA